MLQNNNYFLNHTLLFILFNNKEFTQAVNVDWVLIENCSLTQHFKIKRFI